MEEGLDFVISSPDNDANAYYEVIKKGERTPLRMCATEGHDLRPDGDTIGDAVSYKCTRCIWGTFVTVSPEGEAS